MRPMAPGTETLTTQLHVGLETHIVGGEIPLAFLHSMVFPTHFKTDIQKHTGLKHKLSYIS